MQELSLSSSVIKKIQMAKLLFDLAVDCFKTYENIEKVGSGVILIQDAVELFLLALCEYSNAKVKDSTNLGGLIQALEFETQQQVILKTQIININKQRVNIKHFGFLPNIDDCRDFLTNAKTFFQENSEIFLKRRFDSITLIDLVKDEAVKKLLEGAKECLKKGEYKECQISCRKILYLNFESRFDIKKFEDKEVGREINLLDGMFTDAPFYTRNKEYIKENVKEPVDYICIDHDKLDKELLTAGISHVDYWNIWRLTPKVYYDNIEKEWVIQEDYTSGRYNEQNAEYCFRKTIEIVLLKEKEGEKQRLVGGKELLVCTRLKDNKAKVFKKASLNSEVIHSLENFTDELMILLKTRGLDDKKHYYLVFSNFLKKQLPLIYGYICDEDVVTVDKLSLDRAQINKIKASGF